MGRMTEDEMSRILKLAEVLGKRVIGQEEAVQAVANAIRNHRAGLSEEKKPIGAFLFLGSSGVGKTELAKALAEEIFHSEKNLIRLDMVEYQEAHSISRLIGPPPGYMGNDEGGQLTEAMLDEGHLTDTKNVRVDFTNTIIIMTSNIGQQFILEGYREARAKAEGVIFEPLTDTAMRGVLDLMFVHLTKELEKKGIKLQVADSAKTFILERAWSHKFGGRRMAKYIEKYITAKIAPLLLSAKLKRGHIAQLKRAQNQPNQLNLIICEEDGNGQCKPGTKHGRVLVVQAAKAAIAEGEEEDPLI
ncbi:ATP-dependent chaperone ClpB, related, related [Eimeria brunetti]|uniref:ATP-dependent chaperone ClpB, related, related n=1 Tax=Eimeria brunetti TaxID=51314 RepID=U6L907_9EIME|nr:ATP-dependent chaperone ClpB, related, related [Eimeria brunetti]